MIVVHVFSEELVGGKGLSTIITLPFLFEKGVEFKKRDSIVFTLKSFKLTFPVVLFIFL